MLDPERSTRLSQPAAWTRSNAAQATHLGTGMVIVDGRDPFSQFNADEGRCTSHALNCGNLDLIRSNVTYGSDYDVVITGPDLIKLGFTTHARLKLDFEGQQVEHFIDNTATIIAQPSGMIKRQRVFAGTKDESAILVFKPDLLLDPAWSLAEALPPPLARLGNGPLDGFHWQRFPMSSAMRHCLNDTLAIDEASNFASLLLESKGVELIYHLLEMLGGSATGLLRSGAARERAQLREARQILAQEFARPPTLDKLASSVGMCRSKLVAGFKAEFGITIGAFCLRQRMEEARNLVVGSTLPLALVGYKVGYEHQSSFTAAYRGFFGRAPRDDRA